MLKLLVMSLFISVTAHAGQTASLERYSQSALKAFQKDIADNNSSGVLPLLGFSSIQENGIEGVDIFLASSAEDITAFRYLCNDLSTGVECSFHSMQARCFYYAQVGSFNLSEMSISLHKILSQETAGYENYKIWQFKSSIFSEVDVFVNGVNEKHYYGCQQVASPMGVEIRCEATSSPVGNAP